MFIKKISKEDLAARIIQKVWRGFSSRKKTNLYGRSQGKEVECYLPFGIRKRDSGESSYKMIGGYGNVVLESDLFSVQLDSMNFHKGRMKIPEIVTTPVRQTGETITNLMAEEKVDEAVSYFLSILENFTKEASRMRLKQFLTFDELLRLYNERVHKHPLRVAAWLKEYLLNPYEEIIFSEEKTIVEEHENIDVCLIYDRDNTPLFDLSSTPRTPSASRIVSESAYQEGLLLVHVQKTFSLSVKDYKAESISDDLNITDQQILFLLEARERAERFLDKCPLPPSSDREKIVGLLTLCVEHILSTTKEYRSLHEKADRAVLSRRHILHYIKRNICSDLELKWFADMFRYHRDDINIILCIDKYIPDYKGREGAYGDPRSLRQHSRYDVVFDLFGDFSNQCSISMADMKDPILGKEFEKLYGYGIKSWKDLYENHISLSGRTHLNLQKVVNSDGKIDYQLLFEARRIGLMTIEEFASGKSRISISPNKILTSGQFHAFKNILINFGISTSLLAKLSEESERATSFLIIICMIIGRIENSEQRDGIKRELALKANENLILKSNLQTINHLENIDKVNIVPQQIEYETIEEIIADTLRKSDQLLMKMYR